MATLKINGMTIELTVSELKEVIATGDIAAETTVETVKKTVKTEKKTPKKTAKTPKKSRKTDKDAYKPNHDLSGTGITTQSVRGVINRAKLQGFSLDYDVRASFGRSVWFFDKKNNFNHTKEFEALQLNTRKLKELGGVEYYKKWGQFYIAPNYEPKN